MCGERATSRSPAFPFLSGVPCSGRWRKQSARSSWSKSSRSSARMPPRRASGRPLPVHPDRPQTSPPDCDAHSLRSLRFSSLARCRFVVLTSFGHAHQRAPSHPANHSMTRSLIGKGDEDQDGGSDGQFELPALRVVATVVNQNWTLGTEVRTVGCSVKYHSN